MLGPEQSRIQITHLIEMNELPNISLQVAPFSYGGPFAILRFAEPDRIVPTPGRCCVVTTYRSAGVLRQALLG